MKQLLLYIVFAAVLVSGCKKYEENPPGTIGNKERWIDGSYTLAYYSVNGIDSTTAINDALIVNGAIPFVGFGHEKSLFGSSDYYISSLWFYGQWSLSRKKEHLNISISSYPYGIGPFVNPGPRDWEITKLTKNHIHLKLNEGGKEYILWLHQK